MVLATICTDGGKNLGLTDMKNPRFKVGDMVYCNCDSACPYRTASIILLYEKLNKRFMTASGLVFTLETDSTVLYDSLERRLEKL